MGHSPFDDYLRDVPEPQRSTLQQVREHLMAQFPDAEECMAYGVPAFRIDGITVAGLAARKDGCSYYPMSGSLLDAFDVAALGYSRTKGALQFPADAPLPAGLIQRLVEARLHLGR